MDIYKTLILRGNRALATSLTELNLVSANDLALANERLVRILQSGDYAHASILRILIYEMNVLQENAVLEKTKYPLIDLKNMELPSPEKFGFDIKLCEATGCIPFHNEDSFYFFATIHSLSSPFVDYWNDSIQGNILWYSTDLDSFYQTLENAEKSANVETENNEKKAHSIEL